VIDLRGKRVLVVGLGVSGLWTARWLASQGALITVSDKRESSELGEDLCREISSLGASLESGGHRTETFLYADLIVLSPGVPHDMNILNLARGRGVRIVGELEMACRAISGQSDSLSGVPIIAVTGTNGKSTVTEFIGFLLKNAGLKVFVGGNLGTPLIALACEKEMPDYAVVEVSSFQLDTIETFSPYLSVILNVSPDHLDRYPDYEAYVRSKLRIFENQRRGQFAVLNDDDPVLARCRSPEGVCVLRYGLFPVVDEGFEDQRTRDAFIDGKKISASLGGGCQHEFSLGDFKLPGGHNRSNLLAVILAALCVGIDSDVIQEGIDSFKGLHHRIEFVEEIGGVSFYDDSKATNLDATIKSVESFEAPVVLIAGGRHKGADYEPLVRACVGRVKAAVFIGEAREILAEAFRGSLPYRIAEDMKDAVSLAISSAGPGDVVLLAPACSSFDMFTDYSHRGRVFRDEVRRHVNE